MLHLVLPIFRKRRRTVHGFIFDSPESSVTQFSRPYALVPFPKTNHRLLLNDNRNKFGQPFRTAVITKRESNAHYTSPSSYEIYSCRANIWALKIFSINTALNVCILTGAAFDIFHLFACHFCNSHVNTFTRACEYGEFSTKAKQIKTLNIIVL